VAPHFFEGKSGDYYTFMKESEIWMGAEKVFWD
jgi:hypothetical protein